MPQELITWSAPEFVSYRRGKGWYLVALLVGLVLLWLAWLTRSYFFALLIIVGAVLLWYVGRAKPRSLKIAFQKDSFLFQGRVYRYEKMKLFWLAKTPEGPVLYLVSSRRFSPALTLLVPPQLVNPLRELLLAKEIPEEEGGQEDWLAKLIRFFRI